MRLKDRLATEIGTLVSRKGDVLIATMKSGAREMSTFPSARAYKDQQVLVTNLLALIPDDVTDQISPHAVEEAPHD